MKKRFTTTGVLLTDNKVLIAQRNTSFKDLWEFPGGKNRYNETLEETLKREWKEELDIDITVLSSFLTHSFVNKDTEYTMVCFYVKANNIKPKLTVHKQVALVNIKDLKDYNMMDSDKEICNYLIKQFH